MKRHIKNSIIATWCISFFFEIILVAGSNLMFINSFSARLEEQNHKYNSYVFETFSKNICDSILEVNYLFSDYINSAEIISLIKHSTSDELYKDTRIYDIITTFKRLCESKRILPLIYSEDSDIIISDMGIMQSREYYDLRVSDEDISYDIWLRHICANKNESAYYVSSYMVDGVKNDIVVWKIAYKDGIYFSAAAVKDEFLNGTENNKVFENYNFAIYNQTGNLILKEVKNDKVNFPNRVSELKNYDNSEYSVYKRRIDVRNVHWNVVVITPNDIYWLEFSDYLKSVAALLVIVFILNFILIFCLFKANYYPIKDINSRLGINRNISYDKIRHRLSDILEGYRHTNEQVEKNNDVIYELKLAMLFYNKNLTDELKEAIKKKSKYKNYAILQFFIRDILSFMPDENDIDRKYYYLKYIINNIYTELFAAQNIQVAVTESQNNIICLINIDEASCENAALTDEVAVKGINVINPEFNIELMYALSDIYEGTDNILKAYEQSCEIMDRRLIFGKNAGDGEKQNAPFEIIEAFSGEYTQKFSNCINNGDANGAVKISGEFFDEISKREVPVRYIMLIIHDLVSIILKAASNANIEDDYIIENGMGILQFISSKKSIDEIREKTESLLRYLCEKILSKRLETDKLNRNNKRIMEIVNYLNENYTNPEMNISTVAYAFNLTPYYTSKIFKEATNMNMLDYINKLRIEKADELLKNDDYTVNEIAEMVGFNHSSSFYRVYKKVKGTLPGRHK